MVDIQIEYGGKKMTVVYKVLLKTEVKEFGKNWVEGLEVCLNHYGRQGWILSFIGQSTIVLHKEKSE